ncbi:MAG: Molybdenum cofactor guanylyltransferase [Pseudomonadales bacterium]|nr:Molybdenum cofactor guanylyltransferase [Pseudomonadales bacterium]
MLVKLRQPLRAAAPARDDGARFGAGAVMDEDGRVAGIVLAGGRGSRMGEGGKSLRRLGDRTLLERVWQRAAAQVGLLLLSYNDDPHGLPVPAAAVLADPLPDYPGPLAGILAGLEFLREHHPGRCWLASFACDSPWFPADLVPRLLAAAERSGAEVAVAASDGHLQPVFALWSVTLAPRLRAVLLERRQRGVGAFLRESAHVCVDWSSDADPFFNINTPDELALAERRLRAETD